MVVVPVIVGVTLTDWVEDDEAVQPIVTPNIITIVSSETTALVVLFLMSHPSS